MVLEVWVVGVTLGICGDLCSADGCGWTLARSRFFLENGGDIVLLLGFGLGLGHSLHYCAQLINHMLETLVLLYRC